MTKIFVTGGSGFIGSHLISKLLKMGYAVTNYDIAPSTLNAQATHIIGDIMDFDKLCEAMKGHDIVCHLAAMVGVVACQVDPSEVYEINYEGTKNVVEACLINHVKNVLFASSSEVYGEGGEGNILQENAVLKPLSPYGRAKKQAESLIEEYHLNTGEKSTIIRYCNVYGPRQRVEFVIPIFIVKFLRKEPLTICDQGRQVRIYTYVDDAVEGTIKALFNHENEFQVFNLCSNDILSVLEVAQKIINQGNGSGSIEFVDYHNVKRKRTFEVIYRIPSNQKARNLLGFSPRISFNEGLTTTYDYYRDMEITK